MINEKVLRKIAFIIAIMGIGFLLIFLLAAQKEISSAEEVNSLAVNSKVMLIGFVESERDFGDFKIWNVNGIEVVCNCEESFLDKEVEIIGVI